MGKRLLRTIDGILVNAYVKISIHIAGELRIVRMIDNLLGQRIELIFCLLRVPICRQCCCNWQRTENRQGEQNREEFSPLHSHCSFRFLDVSEKRKGHDTFKTYFASNPSWSCLPDSNIPKQYL